MVAPAWSLRRLHALEESQIDGLADVLIDCVGVAAGERALLVAEDAHGLCATTVFYLDLGGEAGPS
jgi:hypothetical protein